jgi:hypothetical protein
MVLQCINVVGLFIILLWKVLFYLKKIIFHGPSIFFMGEKGVAVALPTHGYQNCTYPKFVYQNPQCGRSEEATLRVTCN